MRSRRRKEEGEETHVESSNWMNTYGDMVTLLLTFFVMLFSFSSIDAKKWNDLANSLKGKGVIELIGKGSKENPDGGNIETNIIPDGSVQIIMEATTPIVVPNPTPEAEQVYEEPEDFMPYTEDTTPDNPEDTENTDVPIKEPDNPVSGTYEEFSQLYIDIQEFINSYGLVEDALVYRDGNTTVIRFLGNILFDPGKAEIRTESIRFLDRVGEILNEYKTAIDTIQVDGHTDNLSVEDSEFATNWHLSSARSLNVLLRLLEIVDVSGEKAMSIGYGEYRPISSNDSEIGQRLNNRVEIVISAN